MSNEKKIESIEIRMAAMEQQLENISKRIATMEIAQTPYGPVTSPYTIPHPQIDWGVNKCPLCGLELKGVMGYVCSQPRCPTGLGPVMC